jgi:hypothetical protein
VETVSSTPPAPDAPKPRRSRAAKAPVVDVSSVASEAPLASEHPANGTALPAEDAPEPTPKPRRTRKKAATDETMAVPEAAPPARSRRTHRAALESAAEG